MEASDCFSIILLLPCIDQKISFQQDLMIQAVHIFIGMMMPDKETDPFQHIGINVAAAEEFPDQIRTCFLLQATRSASMLFPQ